MPIVPFRNDLKCALTHDTWGGGIFQLPFLQVPPRKESPLSFFCAFQFEADSAAPLKGDLKMADEENVENVALKKKKGSKKSKKGWRKKTDIVDVEEHLEDIRREERTGYDGLTN